MIAFRFWLNLKKIFGLSAGLPALALSEITRLTSALWMSARSEFFILLWVLTVRILFCPSGAVRQKDNRKVYSKTGNESLQTIVLMYLMTATPTAFRHLYPVETQVS